MAVWLVMFSGAGVVGDWPCCAGGWRGGVVWLVWVWCAHTMFLMLISRVTVQSCGVFSGKNENVLANMVWLLWGSWLFACDLMW